MVNKACHLLKVVYRIPLMMMISQGSCWAQPPGVPPRWFLGPRLSPLMVQLQQAIPYLPPLVDMQEKTAVQFYTPRNHRGLSFIISPWYDITDNALALFKTYYPALSPSVPMVSHHPSFFSLAEVPQCSALGPIVFNMYTTPLGTLI